MSFSLKGKRALITGSSRGIGSAIAIELAKAGAKVILHCSGETNKAEAVRDKIVKNGGVVENIISANLLKPENTEIIAHHAGEIDILVLNASLQYRKKWNEITTEEFYDQINCNLLSSMRLIQLFAPHMKNQKWGRIITIGSVQEAKPHPDMLVYSASKAAQTNMVKSLAQQFAVDGITVNNVAPGVIYTDRNVDALSNPDYAAKVVNSIPAGYYGEKEDCVGIVVLLSSEEGRYITGQSIYVDGGKSL
ncbi:MAG: short-chain dehydrogenase [Clostridiales bacterium GWF2_36_10]|nr:MAG: short-chain dehydrogenase [Clostridiales bacterium GWF2_36_10]HAN20479.1 short-chain dehydrogenase [Clostridiales bacterium]